MAVDKAVDSAVLDAGLTDIADAIREKGGTSAELSFPRGFVDAVDALDVNTPEVPPEYDQLDYVYFTGVQWIDTGYTWNANSEFRVIASRYNFGMQNFSELVKATNLYLQYGASDGCYVKTGTMSEVNLYSGAPSNIRLALYACYTIRFSASTGQLLTPYPDIVYPLKEYTTTVTTTGPVELSNSSRPWSGLVYAFEVLENDAPVVRMLPAKRRSDGVIGMYDVVRNTFFVDASGNGLAGGNQE